MNAFWFISVALILTYNTYAIYKLRSDLLASNRYDKFARPDISTQKLVVDAKIYLSWQDEHLTWDPAAYGNLKYVNFDPEEIWTPHLQLWYYDVKTSNMEGFDKPYARVYSSGKVSFAIPVVLNSACFLDLTDFPSDKQLCNIYFSTWRYSNYRVNITTYGGADGVLYSLIKNGNWTILVVHAMKEIAKV
ncbi:neuronal acetylcholine receptor subunit alpha-9-like isoform X2 [Dinothrombium tinctorium]|uniref:Neuronal acetylcholine receptor subunit alpha-9-like isoform X2 n=1 Tax=Dinothrombium tinctorium TaxID=1965070 RepID=A0A3S3SP05_9ACAR|nr:neuronal acetylcholine receptor subunit alpha-9-like isoform X2 [Dinothrombium tinctorium]